MGKEEHSRMLFVQRMLLVLMYFILAIKYKYISLVFMTDLILLFSLG